MIHLGSAGRKGRGVFADKRFAKDEVIERAPVIIFPSPQNELLNHTAFKNYWYGWKDNLFAIAFGYGSFYNHSDSPNAQSAKKIKDEVIEITALRDIEAGEEITIKYSGFRNPWSRKVDFRLADAPVPLKKRSGSGIIFADMKAFNKKMADLRKSRKRRKAM